MKVKHMKRLLALLAAVMLLMPVTAAFAAVDGFTSTYSYNYDYWGEVRESPDPYRVSQVIYSKDMDPSLALKAPKSLFVQGEDLYVVDSGNNRIIQLTRIDGKFEFVRIIDHVTAEADDLAVAEERYNAASDVLAAATAASESVEAVLEAPAESIAAAGAEKTGADQVLQKVQALEALTENWDYLSEGTRQALAEMTAAANKAVDQALAGYDAVAAAAAGDAMTGVIRVATDADLRVKAIVEAMTPLTAETISTDGALEAAQKSKAAAERAAEAVEALPAELGFDAALAAMDASAGAAAEVQKAASALKTAVEADAEALEKALQAEEAGFPEADESGSEPEEITEAKARIRKARAAAAAIVEAAGSVQSAADSLVKASGENRDCFADMVNAPAGMAEKVGLLEAAAEKAFADDCKVFAAESKIHLYTQWSPESEAEDAQVVSRLSTPGDVSVDEEGNIYVADTYNNRVVKMTKGCELIMEFIKPADNNFDQNQAFLPNKIVVDTSGRCFVLAMNINKGLVKFEANGVFTGFIGANQVNYNLWDYIWKTYFMTKEQRSQQAAFVPTEYQNIYIDKDDFIYATNIAFSEYDLLWDGAKPIRRLNAVGSDILIKNDRYPPIGDLDWVEGSSDHGPSKLYDITVLDNDIYVAIDHTRGRLFGYDPQGIMLWAFGTSGVPSEGAFNSAVSIEHIGSDLIVLDDLDCSITVFTPTDYGEMIYEASRLYLDGKYDESAAKWEEVLRDNANYNLAFIGIGRSKMRAEEYEEAMELFKMAHDRGNYGRAFRYYRKEWVEKNIWWVVLIILVLVAYTIIRKIIRKVKWEVQAYEHNKVAK